MTPYPKHAHAGAALLAAALLAACASYAPAPLDKQPPLKESLALLHQNGAKLPAALGVEDVARLAIDNNPDLVAARTQLDVAEAQVSAAGILPNPSLSGNYGLLLGGPGNIGSIAAGLSQDLKSIVTLSAKEDAAGAASRQVSATILWQEWQLVGKARLLAVDLIEDGKSLDLLRQSHELLAERLRRSRMALAAAYTTLAMVTPDETAVGDLQKQLDDQERQQAGRERDLDALLGLSAGVSLRLAPDIALPAVDPAEIEALLPDLADRRPDLIALQLGYRAQEAKVRAAVLAQFPGLSLGVAGGRDNSDVQAVGPQITLDLPIFDRNQGNIAIESTTRGQLHAEFSARLAAADGEIRSLMADQALLAAQLETAKTQAQELDRAGARATAARNTGDLDERGYVDIATAALARRLDVVTLERTLLEQRVAIATLIGAGLRPARLEPEDLT